MAGPVRIAILANGSQARRELRGVSNDAQSLGDRFSGVGRKVAAGLAVAGAGAVAFGVSAVKSASDAQQSVGATEAVFGKYANTVVKRSEQAADAVGLSANEYRELANVTGALLKGAGTPLGRVADLTDRLNTRAADLAATFGGTTKDAVSALAATLRGEYDPIERYGISLRKSDVNARLAEKGLDKLTGTALKQAEQQATLELLFGQSADSAGQFAREVDTLAGQQQRANAEFENAKASLGTALLPIATKFFGYLREKGVPALERLATYLNDNEDKITAAGEAFADRLFPAVQKTADVVGDLVGLVASVPAPLRNMALQAGVAAAVFPRLNGVVQSAGVTFGNLQRQSRAAHAELGAGASRVQRLQATFAGLGGGLRNVAGVGGMVALTQGATSSNKALSTLANVGGGAMLGFAVGGPIGAAIGGGAGALLSLYQNTRQAGDEASEAAPKFNALRESLDQVSGAATEATRAQVLQQVQSNGLAAAANTLGISTRTLVNASLGQRDAMRQVAAATDKSRDTDLLSMTSKDQVADATRRLREQFGQEAAQIQRNGAVIRDYSGKLRGLPRELKTDVRANGIVPTTEGIARLTRRYNLTPRQIRTLIQASGAETTVRQVQNVNKGLESVKNAKGNPARWNRDLSDGVAQGKTTSRRGGSDIGNLLTQGTTKAKANLSPLQTSLSRGIATGRGTAASGGSGIGQALANGVSGGIFSRVASVASAAAAMVSRALAAARAQAEVRSPSRKTRKLGVQLGDGLQLGVRDTRRNVERSGALIASSIITGMGDGLSGAARLPQQLKLAGMLDTLSRDAGRPIVTTLGALRSVTAPTAAPAPGDVQPAVRVSLAGLTVVADMGDLGQVVGAVVAEELAIDADMGAMVDRAAVAYGALP